jgi:hypothetical protein
MKESHSLRGFAHLVAALREAQKKRDRTGDARASAMAQTLESHVDAALREILSPTLFGAEDDT